MTGVSLTRDEFIRQYLAVDTTSPTGLRRLGHPHKAHAARCTGRPAGTPDSKGYCRTIVHGRMLLNHRIIWFLHHGEWPIGDVDHIDGNPRNNHPDNLRDVGRTENNHNRAARGYHWHKRARKWLAQIQLDGKKHNLGYFNTEAEARAAYLAAKVKYHPTAPGRCFD